MLYRLITLIGGLVFVAALFALVWFFCKKFLEHHGVTDQTSDRATVLATWTFAGIAILRPSERKGRFFVRVLTVPGCC